MFNTALFVLFYLAACILPFVSIGAVVAVCAMMLRRKLWWHTPMFAIASIGVGYLVMEKVARLVPSSGYGDFTPAISGIFAGSALTIAASLLAVWLFHREQRKHIATHD